MKKWFRKIPEGIHFAALFVLSWRYALSWFAKFLVVGLSVLTGVSYADNPDLILEEPWFPYVGIAMGALATYSALKIAHKFYKQIP